MSDKSLFSIETLEGESKIAAEKEIFSIMSLPFSPKNEVNPFYMETEEELEAQFPVNAYASPKKTPESDYSFAVTDIAFTIEPYSEVLLEEEELIIPQMEVPKDSVFSTDNYTQYEVYIVADVEVESVDNQIDDVYLEIEEPEIAPAQQIFEKEEMPLLEEDEIKEDTLVNNSLSEDNEYIGSDFSDLLEEDKTETLVESFENEAFLAEEEAEILAEIPLIEVEKEEVADLQLEAAEKAAAILREQQLEAKNPIAVENTVHFQKKNRRFNIKVSEEELAKYFQTDKIKAEGVEDAAPKGQVDSIIDKFLQEQPQMKRPNMKANFEELLIEEEEVPETEIVTETMAKLHLLQGNKLEAINIYEKLCLVFPEKISYFAEQIQKLNHK